MAADARRNTPLLEPGCHGSGSGDARACWGETVMHYRGILDRGINLLRDDSLINNLDVMSLITTWEFLINSQMLRART